MRKIFFLLVFSSLSVGCAVNPNERFAGSLDQVRSSDKIDVVIDSFVVSDIKGKSLGYNVEKNKQRATELKDTLVSLLEDRGYEPNVVFVGSGFHHEIDTDAEIFYSEDWTSTGTSFPGSEIIEGDSGWGEELASEYARAAYMEAKGANWTPPKVDLLTASETIDRNVRMGLLPEQKEARRAIFSNPPDVVSRASAPNVMFVKYANIDISAGKKFGVGLLTGAVSLASSGGTTATVMTFTEKGPIEVSLMNMETQQVVWATESVDTSLFDTEEKKINAVLKLFPKR